MLQTFTALKCIASTLNATPSSNVLPPACCYICTAPAPAPYLSAASSPPTALGLRRACSSRSFSSPARCICTSAFSWLCGEAMATNSTTSSEWNILLRDAWVDQPLRSNTYTSVFQQSMLTLCCLSALCTYAASVLLTPPASVTPCRYIGLAPWSVVLHDSPTHMHCNAFSVP